MRQLPPYPTLFPYTTLFRSISGIRSKNPCGNWRFPSKLGRVSYMRNQTRIAASTTPARYVTASLRSEEHTSELQSRGHLVCRLLLEKKKSKDIKHAQEDTRV